MRVVATVLCWVVATLALAVAVPAGWAQRNLVDTDGYAALAAKAAHDPQLQNAMAAELAAQLGTLARSHGFRGDNDVVLGVATAYTDGPSFPGQFADANRVAHRWLFTDSARATDEGWQIDLTPMLDDTTFKQTLRALNISVPQSVTVPVTSDTIQPGQLKPLATWGPWVSIGSVVLTAVAALLTLAFARHRGKALAALGISALLVGGGGWAALAFGGSYIDDALNRTTGNVHTIASVMVAHAEGSLHQWLNLTLAAGAVLVVFGVIVAVLGSLRRKQHSAAQPT